MPIKCFLFTLEDIFGNRKTLISIIHWNSFKAFVFVKPVILALLDTGAMEGSMNFEFNSANSKQLLCLFLC